ncbi:MFS transporter, partial [Frankia sp. EI5c]|uniref:MFS transporter n=1 Tax=Frankia sp. EI5c TaxID=683316 RepID=UPI0037BE676E
MVTAVLPLYLVERLGFTPFQYGLVSGLYQGASALSRLVSGFVSDRFHRHRDVAAAGYAMSAVAKVVLAAGGTSPSTLSGALAADQIGKGVRTAPRDAMLSLSAPPARLGFVFGLHRAMDTVGAMLGPFVAFALLAVSPGSYDLVFVLSACVGLVGVAVIVLLVRPPSTRSQGAAGAAGERPSPAATLGLLRSRRFRRLACVGVGLALCTVGDGFVYLRLQQQVSLAGVYFPLLAAGVYCVYLALALPLGYLADLVGRQRVFVGGYLALSGVYLVLCRSEPGVGGLVAVLVLLGAYYAATDGMLAAAASALVPARLRTGGLALVQTGVALAQLAGAASFGALWTLRGPDVAFRWAVAAGLVAVVLAVVALRGVRVGRSGPGEGDDQ